MSIVAYTGGGSGTDVVPTTGTTYGILGNNKVHRNSIFFRFASEGNVVEKVEFVGNDIAVGDLKQAISDLKKLEKLDLVLVNEATGEVYQRDGKLLQRNMSILVRRTPQIKKRREPRVLEFDSVDCWKNFQEEKDMKASAAPKVPIQQRVCPQEYLCKVCGQLFEDPYISRCCGHSACLRCLPAMATGSRCPLCSREWTSDLIPIPNPRLADCISSLDLDYFILPSSPGSEKPTTEPRTCSQGIGTPLAGTEARAEPAAHVAAVNGAGLPVPPVGVEVRPCMLSPEQFLAWQQSLRRGGSSSSRSSSARRRRKRKDKHAKDKSKKAKTSFQ